MDESRLSVVRDLVSLELGRETIYEEEDLRKLRTCIANRMLYYEGFSAIGCILISRFYPFKTATNSLVMKRLFLASGLWLTATPFISSLARAICLDEHMPLMRLKPEHLKETKPVAEEVKTLPPASFESEMSNISSYEQPDSYSTDFQNYNFRENTEEPRDTGEGTSKKKYITYDDLRRLNSEHKDTSFLVNSSSPEISEPGKKITNIYGDIIE